MNVLRLLLESHKLLELNTFLRITIAIETFTIYSQVIY